MISPLSKAAGCLAGVALGDALGRATEFMTRQQIRARFGRLEGFTAPFEGHPGHRDPLGVITDDTEQTLIIARLLATGAALTPERVAGALVAWAREHDGLASPYLGPSTRRALAALMDGASPHETKTRPFAGIALQRTSRDQPAQGDKSKLCAIVKIATNYTNDTVFACAVLRDVW